MRLIFDSNIFDELVAGNLPYELLANSQVEVFATHIQIDELCATPESHRRDKILGSLKKINLQVIPTESRVTGTSRIGFAKIGDGNIINELRTGEKGKWRHTNDALIGETAIKNGLTLITNEKKGLRSRVERLSGKVMSSAELKMELERLKQFPQPNQTPPHP